MQTVAIRADGEPMKTKTLYDKLWDDHVVRVDEHGTALLYIDRQLVHEVTSPQAFEGLRLADRPLRRADANLATADHNVPTTDRSAGIADPVSRLQVDTLDRNCAAFGILEFGMSDPRQGIVHVVGPEQGATLPGMTVVCGDSHTSTHGALGALAFGIGTSEVEHVLATQCLIQTKSKSMLVVVDGRRRSGCDGERHRAGDHRAHRHGRWHRVCGRVQRRGHQELIDRRPNDGLQHGDRGGCPGRICGGRRQDDRLRARPTFRPERRAFGMRLRPIGAPCTVMMGQSSTRS